MSPYFNWENVFFVGTAIILTVIFFIQKQRTRGGFTTTKHRTGRSILEQYSTNFNTLAQQRKLDPVIGREREVAQLIRILSRKTKNNALLLGEPGVGKTAVVERLAILITQGAVPEPLKPKAVIALDLGSLVSGTKYRGELEGRLEAIRQEFRNQQSNVILFIDEIQTLAQAKGSEGGLNPADILKPELARGFIQVIGATTYEDYEKYILPDETLERRFQPIHIHEATSQETLNILQGVKSVFEQFHHVRYDDQVLPVIVSLANTYITKRYLPDKAIDVLDEAGVRARIQAMKQKNTNPVVDTAVVKQVIADWIDQPLEKIQ